jgi:hypothetical protein
MGRTASDLKKRGWPREEMEKYHPWASLDRYGKDRDILYRRDQALVVSRGIAGVLKKKYRATRVVLFGSLCPFGKPE